MRRCVLPNENVMEKSKSKEIRFLVCVGMCGCIACAQILLSFAFQQNESLFNMAEVWRIRWNMIKNRIHANFWVI